MTLKPLSPQRNITSSDYYSHAAHLKEKKKNKQKQQQNPQDTSIGFIHLFRNMST